MDIVVIGDTHFGSSVGLAPRKVTLDDGHVVNIKGYSKFILDCWEDFWEWVDKLLAGAPFILVHNGDVVDNQHHQTLQVLSGNTCTQKDIALEMMKPIVAKAKAYYQIRGTPAHTGEQAQLEEDIARSLKAVKEGKNASRYVLWVRMGNQIIHFAHHIPTSGSHAYKSSPAMRLMAQAFADAGEWGLKPPNIMIRSHVHDYIKVARANCQVAICPCWQAKTGFIWKKDTMTEPVLGGLVIRNGKDGVYIKERTYRIPRPKMVVL